MKPSLLVFVGAAVLGIASAAPRETTSAAQRELALTDLVMGDKDDARSAIALGPTGEVYAPVKGAWTRTQAITTADRIDRAGRASGVVVSAEGAVYKLADNGWSALRLTQKGKAVMSSGGRAVGAVGRQLFALDRSANGEPMKLGQAPGNVLAIGASDKSIVVATDKGLFRSANAATSGIATTGVFKPIARAPKRVDRLLDDKFGLVDRGVVDLDSGVVTAWPAGFRVSAATVVVTSRAALALTGEATAAGSPPPTAPADEPDPKTTKSGKAAKGKAPGKTSKTPASSPKAAARSGAKTAAKKGSGTLVIAVGTRRGVPTLVVVDGGTTQTETIEVDPDAAVSGANGAGANGGANGSGANGGGTSGGGTNGRSSSRKSQQSAPVGVVADRSGRIAVAFAGGAIALRDKGTWTTSMIAEALPAPRPGAPPAPSGPS